MGTASGKLVFEKVPKTPLPAKLQVPISVAPFGSTVSVGPAGPVGPLRPPYLRATFAHGGPPLSGDEAGLRRTGVAVPGVIEAVEELCGKLRVAAELEIGDVPLDCRREPATG